MSILQRDILGEESLHLPIDGLPYQAQEIIRTTAKALDCPVEYVVASAMQAVAQAAGDRFCWDNGVYQDYPQFYTAIVGQSTDNKTGAIKKMMKPIEEADSISYEQWLLSTAGKTKEEKSRIPYRCNLLNDYTLEAYQDALKFNPDGVTAACDEILSFFGNMNRYRTSGADEKFFLTCFGSYSPFKKARVGNIDYIPHPIVRIIGGIQPEILAESFHQSPMLADGMLPRFLWYLKPDDFRLDESGTKIVTAYTDALWRGLIFRIIDKKEKVKVVFDSQSDALYTDYKLQHKKAKNAQSLFGYEASVCGKLEVYAVIWAMTVAIMRYAELSDTQDTIYICEAEMKYTLRCMEYFRQTAMKVYDTITAGNVPKKKDCILGLKDYILNQSQFAESIGVGQSYVSQVLSGKK